MGDLPWWENKSHVPVTTNQFYQSLLTINHYKSTIKHYKYYKSLLTIIKVMFQHYVSSPERHGPVTSSPTSPPGRPQRGRAARCRAPPAAAGPAPRSRRSGRRGTWGASWGKDVELQRSHGPRWVLNICIYTDIYIYIYIYIHIYKYIYISI